MSILVSRPTFANALIDAIRDGKFLEKTCQPTRSDKFIVSKTRDLANGSVKYGEKSETRRKKSESKSTH